MKYCKRCDTDKPLKEFGRVSGSSHLHKQYCKPCTASYMKEYRANIKAETKKDERFKKPWDKPGIESNEVDEIYVIDGTIKCSPEDFEMLSYYNWDVDGSGDVKAWGKREQISLGAMVLDISEGSTIEYINKNKLDNRRENIKCS